MSVEKEAGDVIRKLEEIRDRRARVEGAIQSCERELESIRKQCRDLGVDPDSLDTEISNLENKISAQISDLRVQIDHMDKLLSSVNY